MNQPPWKTLVEAAGLARKNAHAPYSSYLVGAALLTADGRIFAGCNVENASYGATLCAERNAVAQMVAAGARDIAALVVVTEGPEPGSPCGICRQTLAEFADDLPIGLAVAGDDAPRTFETLRGIFPKPFRGDLVKKP
jgi:cytidine deaminase